VIHLPRAETFDGMLARAVGYLRAEMPGHKCPPFDVVKDTLAAVVAAPEPPGPPAKNPKGEREREAAEATPETLPEGGAPPERQPIAEKQWDEMMRLWEMMWADIARLRRDLRTPAGEAVTSAAGEQAKAAAEPASKEELARKYGGPVFKPGDLVEFRSGGPLMTVEKVEGDSVYCAWMDGPDLIGKGFPASLLVAKQLAGRVPGPPTAEERAAASD